MIRIISCSLDNCPVLSAHSYPVLPEADREAQFHFPHTSQITFSESRHPQNSFFPFHPNRLSRISSLLIDGCSIQSYLGYPIINSLSGSQFHSPDFVFTNTGPGTSAQSKSGFIFCFSFPALHLYNRTHATDLQLSVLYTDTCSVLHCYENKRKIRLQHHNNMPADCSIHIYFQQLQILHFRYSDF